MPKRASAAKPPRSLGPSDTPHQKKQQIPRRASNKAHLQPPRFKRILVALDGSPSSKYALDWATLLAEKLGAKLALVSVAPRFDLGLELVASPRNWQMIEAAFSEGEDRAKDVLEEAEVILRRKKLEATTTLLRGEPGQRIVEMARTSEADLVVLGSHGHGLAERFQLGSVGGTVKHTV
jgi:nucleotide-binding universal stress UspA family protein